MSRAPDGADDRMRAARRAEAERLNAASPSVVDLAQELKVDLTGVKNPTGQAGQISVEDVCRASGLPTDHSAYLTFVDAARAARLGMQASDFTATGPHGLITGSDIRKVTRERAQAEARAVRAASSISAASTTAASSRTVEQPSAFSGKRVKIDPWSRNPLADDARQADPRFYNAALAEGPAPTLFKSGGDLPAFLASGADPQMLLRLPWIARHAAAKADGQKLFRMVEDLSGSDGVDIAWLEANEYVDDAANREYAQRFQDWLDGAGQDPNNSTPARQIAMDIAYDGLFPEEAQKRREAAAAVAQKEAKARYDADRKRIQSEVHTIDARRGQAL